MQRWLPVFFLIFPALFLSPTITAHDGPTQPSEDTLLNTLKCQPVGAFKGLEVVLHEQAKPEQRLIVIHNKSSNPIWVTHPVDNPSVSAGWTTPLAVNRWSAIAIKRRHFALACVEALPGAEQRIPCSASIEICEVRGPVFHAKNGGTYWVTDNQRLDKLIRKIREREIELPG